MSTTTTCPSCQRPLRIPETLIGQQAKCPACGATFLAALDSNPASAPSPAEPAPERPAERRIDPGPAEDDRPVRRQRDEEDEDDRPVRRRRRKDYDDHRGGLILAMGICSFIVAPIPFGQIAWFLGNKDMAEIRAGRMDPEGEGLTQVGRILGMVSSLMFLAVLVLICLVAGVFVLILAGRGGK